MRLGKHSYQASISLTSISRPETGVRLWLPQKGQRMLLRSMRNYSSQSMQLAMPGTVSMTSAVSWYSVPSTTAVQQSLI